MMTDEQIIKALKYCKRDSHYVKCNSNCPMYEYCESDQENDMNICGLAFDLVNRLKMEVADLTDENEVLNETNTHLCNEYIDLMKECDQKKAEIEELRQELLNIEKMLDD